MYPVRPMCGSLPMSLMPIQINGLVVKGNWADTAKYHVMDCIECGCCSYSCPASRNLVQSFRYAKAELRNQAAREKAKAAKGGA